MTAISITLIILAVVAMILGTAQVLDPSRRLYGFLSILAGFTSLLVLAGLNGWGIAFTPIDVPWKAALAVVSLASVVVGLATTRTVFTTIGLIGFGLTAFFVLGQPWWVMALAIATGLFVALDAITDRAIFALAALVTVVGMLATATYDMRSVRDAIGVTAAIEQAKADLTAQLKKELDGMKANPGSLEAYCKLPGNQPVCEWMKSKDAKDAEQDKTITALQSSNTKQWAAMLKAGVVAIPADADTDAMAKALADAFAKAGYTNVRIGNNVDWTLPGANQRYAGAFGQQTLRSQTMWVEYINSPAGAAARQNLLDRTPTELHDRFLSGKGLVPWQAMEKSCTIGNWSLVDGKPVQIDHEVCHDVGDVWWTPVGPDGTVYMEASTRAACRNGHTSVTPYPAGHTPKVCPAGSDRAGQTIGKGCWNAHPKIQKVRVCAADGLSLIWVPPAEAGKYPKPNSAGNCSKMGSDLGLNPGEGGSGGVNGNNGATDSRGQQNDPAADAKAAADKAAADAKAAEDAAKAAADAASTDSGAGDTPQGQSSGSPTGDGGNQGGDDIWGGN